MRCRGALSLSLALLACDDGKAEKAVPTASPPRQGMFIDDTPTKSETALAIGTEGEGSLRVTVPLAPLDCDALRSAYPERPEGAFLDFWLRRPLEADGAAGPWAIRSAYLQDGRDGRGLITRGALIDDVVAAGAGHKLVGLELATQDRQRQLTYTGDLVAKDCGRVARPEEDRPQKALAVTVAGQAVAIHGASVRPEAGKLYLRLTRAPHACGSVFTEGYDFYLDLALTGEPPKIAFASLQGDAFPGDPSGSKGAETFVIESEEELRGTGAIEVALEGKLDLGDYAVTITGTVEVLRCTPSP